MSETRFTPGPWTAERLDWRGEPSPHHVYISGDSHVSCEDDDDEAESEECNVSTAVAIVEGNATSQSVTEANSRLIAASPCLLAACIEVIKGIDSRTGGPYEKHVVSREIRKLRNAIAKATGEEPA